MSRTLAIAVLLLATCAPFAVAESPLVATWNLRNLSVVDRFEDGRYRFAYPMPEGRKAAIRDLLLEVRPAVLFLQEIGSPAFLEELRLDLATRGLAYPHAAFSGFPGSRSGLAVLSLHPLQEVILHDPAGEDPATPVKRGVQEVAIRFQSILFRFFHVHLKSRYSTNPDDPDSRIARTREIRSLAAFLTRQLAARPAGPLVLLGDFNTPFPDPLLLPLARDWESLPAVDSIGAQWTYFHARSSSRERLDGFWFPRSRPAPLGPARILPPDHSPSDHRLLLAPLLFP